MKTFLRKLFSPRTGHLGSAASTPPSPRPEPRDDRSTSGPPVAGEQRSGQ